MRALETSRLITDLYSAKITLATMREAMSAKEMSERLGIPIAACYRKIRQLEDAGLLSCTERRITRSGKRVSYYKSKVKNANIEFSEGVVMVSIKKTDGPVENYTYVLPANIVNEETRDCAIH
ncbi:MAG: hypothetical protein PWQ88_57 [Candidatus Methanomethylophilaceae archaeon]|nr:hypothetical protein [Candidatus Methanomethylophilaceae archaeon]MDI3541802.1 hypothetical protein [Candidatus Methanomethylophilaceae archaeon]HIJ00279.1 helix-turn-helix transcriptional regulator [Candidatus Methanomethylophilaceae archaeon]